MSINAMCCLVLMLSMASTTGEASAALHSTSIAVVRAPVHLLPMDEGRDFNPNHQQYAGTVKTFPGTYQYMQAIAYDADDNDFFLSTSNGIYRVTLKGYATWLTSGYSVEGLVYDSTTKLVYIAETRGYQILAMDPKTGVTTLVAGGTRGTADGQGAAAQFQAPQGIALDPSGTLMYVTDHDRVRMVTTGGNVTTLTAPGSIGLPSGNCSGTEQEGIAYDTSDRELYVADSCANMIRRVDPFSHTVSVIAGQCVINYNSQCQALQRDGVGQAALFNNPTGIAYDAIDNRLYVTDFLNNQIREVAAGSGAMGAVTTIAGSGHTENFDGIGDHAGFTYPIALTIGPRSDAYIADEGNSIIRTMITNGPPAPKAKHGIKFYYPPTLYAAPYGIAATADGSIWFGERYNQSIGRIFPNGATVEYNIGGSNGEIASMMVPDKKGNVWFIAGPYNSSEIGVINSVGRVKLYTIPNETYGIQQLTIGADGNVWFACGSGFIGSVAPDGTINEYISDSGSYITAGFGDDVWTSGSVVNSGVVDEYSLSGHLMKTYLSPDIVGGWMIQGPGKHIWFAQPSAIGEVLAHVLLLYTLPPPPQYTWNLQGLVEAPDASMWFTSGLGYLGRLTTNGNFTPIEVRTPGSQPQSITVAPDGSIWFTDSGALKIGRWY